MNVARAVLNCLVQDKIDKANDRGRVRLCFNRSGAIFFTQLQKLTDLPELLENLLHASRVGAVIPLDLIFDLLGRRNDDVNLFAEREAKILRRAIIERINERDINILPLISIGSAPCNRASPLGIKPRISGAISRSARLMKSVPRPSAIV